MARKHRFKVLVVLNDTVMYQINLANMVWVSIAFTWFTMRCPAGVSDADRIARLMLSDELFQRCHLAFGAQQGWCGRTRQGDNSGAVIAAVLEPL